ncbi:Type 1 glutamine amidotransferase-like domain-containing protein [Candidatus Dependentiae bacterium]
MGKIVAIGGGEIGGSILDLSMQDITRLSKLGKEIKIPKNVKKRPVETQKIDEEIIKLSGKKNPRLLFLPTASWDSNIYVDDVKNHFGKRLGCVVDVLYLVHRESTKKEIEEKILGADIIYVGGGNTLMMMCLWRKLGVDKVLERVYKNGIVLSGISAGSICWFESGLSDSKRFKSLDEQLIKVSGLGLIGAFNCPHYHSELYAKDRAFSLKETMKKTPGVAIAVDDFCAFEIVDDSYRIITSKPGASAYKVYWKRGNFFNEKIEEKQEFLPLVDLLTK